MNKTQSTNLIIFALLSLVTVNSFAKMTYPLDYESGKISVQNATSAQQKLDVVIKPLHNTAATYPTQGYKAEIIHASLNYGTTISMPWAYAGAHPFIADNEPIFTSNVFISDNKLPKNNICGLSVALFLAPAPSQSSYVVSSPYDAPQVPICQHYVVTSDENGSITLMVQENK